MAEILVLDDIFDAANLVKRIANRMGHNAHAFTNPKEAINHVSDNNVDLAILDMMLPDTTGIEVLEELKQLQPNIRAIMLTGYPTLETARASKELGALDYCVKPIDKAELEEKITLSLDN
ncbi:MAG: response regulator [Desulfovibrio sp.]